MERKQMKGAGAVLVVSSLVLAAIGFLWGVPHALASLDDYGSTAQTAAAIGTNAPITGQIDSRTDQDWFVLPPLNGAPATVTVLSDGFSLRLAVFDGAMRQVGAAPGAGSTSMGGSGSMLPIAPGVADPIRLQITAAGGALGRYSLNVQASHDPALPPHEPPAAPPPPPAPPPPVPTDDVPPGQPKTIAAVPGAADGRLETPGDTDGFVYTAGVEGTYLMRLTATDAGLTDGVADLATAAGTVQLAVWFPDPVAVPLGANEIVHLTVRSLGGEAIGGYHLDVAAPAAPPPPATPSGDVTLAFDVRLDALAQPSRAYATWEYSSYRFRDASSVNGELMAAAAVHDRFVARERGSTAARASADSNGSLDAVIRRLGTNQTSMTRSYSTLASRLSQTAVKGGGTTVSALQTLRDGLAAGRPVLLVGVRPDNLLKVWVVYGIETVDGVVTLKTLDPSQPARTTVLRMTPGVGIESQALGGARLTDRFAFAGFEKDTLP